jgi:hypothetical protein
MKLSVFFFKQSLCLGEIGVLRRGSIAPPILTSAEVQCRCIYSVERKTQYIFGRKMTGRQNRSEFCGVENELDPAGNRRQGVSPTELLPFSIHWLTWQYLLCKI